MSSAAHLGGDYFASGLLSHTGRLRRGGDERFYDANPQGEVIYKVSNRCIVVTGRKIFSAKDNGVGNELSCYNSHEVTMIQSLDRDYSSMSINICTSSVLNLAEIFIRTWHQP